MPRLGPLQLASPFVLAPMAGVTDRDFRLLVRRIGGVGLVTMEFIQSRALVRGVGRTLDLMHFVDEERPISIQIYGADAPTMQEAARKVEAMGADACDINMGCPANKVLKGCSGCALMSDLGLAREIVAACRRALSIPLARRSARKSSPPKRQAQPALADKRLRTCAAPPAAGSRP